MKKLALALALINRRGAVNVLGHCKSAAELRGLLLLRQAALRTFNKPSICKLAKLLARLGS